ncbi:MAG TPA: FKBP-type peptidyl-prolyl cis-trans isomerase [Usitatibacter sp.]|nr:FKBP-type peptidyl-prolyl cis-trans isomerase [Usitatibacter sp.]
MKRVIIAAFLAAFAVGFANADEAKKDEAKKCDEPPKELVMKDLALGAGDTVEFKSAALVSYTGWLWDGCAPDHKGAMFDTSQGRVTPFGFVVGAGRVIKGWDEGVMGMKVDGKRLLIIPPDKGYGAAGAGNGKIPPNATLVFEVYLLKILNAGTATKGPPPHPAPATQATPK